MAEESPTPPPPTNAPSSEQSNPAEFPPPVSAPPTTVQDRAELLARARMFLNSPQILEQDVTAKRKFLSEKGLSEMEIERLLREPPLQRPAVPPRTYPQPPPSNLPTLLLGLARLFSWIAGGSAVLVAIYYRFLLPRIAQTFHARRSIKTHHLTLMRRLTTSLASLKESQAESHAVLPRPQPYREPVRFSGCHSVSEVLEKRGEKDPVQDIPPVSLIRCGIQDYAKGREGDASKPTTEGLFQYLEGQVPWLASEEGLKYELWETLSTCPLFTATPSLPTPSTGAENLEQIPTRWTYTAPTPPDPSPLLQSLTTLSSALPRVPRSSSYQHTLQTLSDFTGYISTQLYQPFRPVQGNGFYGLASTLGPVEEEFKREVRALKGLVLNRRSFMPAIPRTSSAPPAVP